MKSYCKALIIIKTGCIKINVINENKSFSVNRKIDNIPTVLGVLISSIDAIFK